MTFTNISKSFAEVQALKGVSFTIPPNSIFGLLGPNGAGKTTLIRIITKIFAADSGEIVFNNTSITTQAYSSIGYMPEEKGMYKKMKVGEQLLYLAQLKGVKKNIAKERISMWFEKLEVTDWWNKKIEDLSKGMQQKAQFIATVLHEPALLILDEPFSGLDPVNAELIKNEIFAMHKKGVTIIFSTHRMEQVEEICKNIMLINKGNVITHGEVKEIKNTFKENKFELVFSTQFDIPSTSIFDTLQQHDTSAVLSLKKDISRNALLSHFINEGKEIISFKEILPTLNEIFIKLVNTDNHA